MNNITDVNVTGSTKVRKSLPKCKSLNNSWSRSGGVGAGLQSNTACSELCHITNTSCACPKSVGCP